MQARSARPRFPCLSQPVSPFGFQAGPAAFPPRPTPRALALSKARSRARKRHGARLSCTARPRGNRCSPCRCSRSSSSSAHTRPCPSAGRTPPGLSTYPRPGTCRRPRQETPAGLYRRCRWRCICPIFRRALPRASPRIRRRTGRRRPGLKGCTPLSARRERSCSLCKAVRNSFLTSP